MSELVDKFHDGMTVKIRCGGVLEGVNYYEGRAFGYRGLDETGLGWYPDGSYCNDDQAHPLDIVEVLYNKPQLTLEECLNSENLCGGMTFTRDGAKLTICVVNGEYYAAFDNNRTLLYRVDAIRSIQPWILSED
jgi:hypothetical protein